MSTAMRLEICFLAPLDCFHFPYALIAQEPQTTVIHNPTDGNKVLHVQIGVLVSGVTFLKMQFITVCMDVDSCVNYTMFQDKLHDLVRRNGV